MRKRLHERDYRRFGPYETEIREKRSKFPLIPLFILAVVICICLILMFMLVSAAEIQQIQVKIDDEDWRNVSIGEHVSFNTGKKDVDLYFKIDYPTEIEINVFGLNVFDLKNVTKEEDYIFTTYSTDFSLHFTVKEKANKSFIFLRGNNGNPLIAVVVSYTQYNPPSVDEMISEARDNILRLRYEYHCFDLAERLEDALNSAGNNEYKIRKVWEETNEEVNKREDIEREIEKLEKRAYSLEDEKLRELILAEIKDAKLDLKNGKSLEYLNAEIQHIYSLFDKNSNWLLLVIALVLFTALILCIYYVIKWLKGG